MMTASTTDVTAMRTSDEVSVDVVLPSVELNVTLQPHDTASTHEQLSNHSDVDG